MSDKYVIKNCPALIKEAFQNNQIDGIARTTQIRKNLCFYNTSLQCENITNCVMKKIVEKCSQKFYDNDFDKGKLFMANEILLMLMSDKEACE